VSLRCLLAVSLVITWAHPTNERENPNRDYRLDVNATAEEDYGWYAPVAMLFTLLSKESAEGRRKASGQGYLVMEFPFNGGNANPWHGHPERNHLPDSNDSQLSRIIDSIMETGAVYLPKKSASSLETNSQLISKGISKI
jgi:hypothetical protein